MGEDDDQPARAPQRRGKAAPAQPGDTADQAPAAAEADADADDGPPELPGDVEWFTASEPLFIYNPDAGAGPARAHSPGDRVHRDAVEQHGWHRQVSVPEWATAPPAPANSHSEEHQQLWHAETAAL